MTYVLLYYIIFMIVLYYILEVNRGFKMGCKNLWAYRGGKLSFFENNNITIGALVTSSYWYSRYIELLTTS